MVIDEVRRVLTSALQLGDRKLEPSTPLVGGIPEFDSMAVVSVITALEEQFDITVDDDEIDAATFETLATLAAYVERKLSH